MQYQWFEIDPWFDIDPEHACISWPAKEQVEAWVEWYYDSLDKAAYFHLLHVKIGAHEYVYGPGELEDDVADRLQTLVDDEVYDGVER